MNLLTRYARMLREQEAERQRAERRREIAANVAHYNCKALPHLRINLDGEGVRWKQHS